MPGRGNEGEPGTFFDDFWGRVSIGDMEANDAGWKSLGSEGEPQFESEPDLQSEVVEEES